jgi:hypothetical protein
MSAAENRFDLALIGERAASKSVLESHFPVAFDLPALPLQSTSTKGDPLHINKNIATKLEAFLSSR